MSDEEKQRGYALAEKLISEQNFAAAVISGAVATILAAVAFGMTVATWEFSNGFAAAGVGIVVGLTIQFLGRGISTKFFVAAAVYTVTGCVLGGFFRVVMRQAQAVATSPIEVFRDNSLPVLLARTMSNLAFVDLVYWFVAVVCAVFLARRPLSRSDRLAIGLYQMRGI